MKRFSQPIEIPRPVLIGAFGCTSAAIVLLYLAQPYLPTPWRTAGSPELYFIGVVSIICIAVPVLFSLAKRSWRTSQPRIWFIAHMLAGSLSALLVVFHSAGNWGRPPAILVLLILCLVAQGYWARTKTGDPLAATMASRPDTFSGADPTLIPVLKNLIEAKQKLLVHIDAAAIENLFSPTLKHWLKHPFKCLAYARLAQEEANHLNSRGSVNRALSFWRRIHIIAAGILIAGVFIHIVTVTFFAGYVAGRGEIYWWHLAEWGR
jgi:hypothetical protein